MRFSVAPWPTSLKAVSALSCAVLIVVPFLAWQTTSRAGPLRWLGGAVAWISLLVIAGSLLFVVTEYELDDHRLSIRRLL